MSDRQLDVITGDLVDGPAGSFADVDVLQNKLLMSYAVPRGTWEGDPLLGHRFAELARTTDLDVGARLRDLVKDAVQWLIDSGELARVDVDTWHYARGVWAFTAAHYPPGVTKPIKIGPNLVPVGAGGP